MVTPFIVQKISGSSSIGLYNISVKSKDNVNGLVQLTGRFTKEKFELRGEMSCHIIQFYSR